MSRRQTKTPSDPGRSGGVSDNSSSQKHVHYTAFKSRKPLSKAYALAEDGSLIKTPAASMTAGQAKRVTVDFSQFGAKLDRAGPCEAFCYGLHDVATYGEAVKIATANKAEPAKGILARTRDFFDYRQLPGVLMVDHDPHPDGQATTPQALLETLEVVFPGFTDAAVWIRGSLSAGVHREGEAPKPRGGFHLYFGVEDAADIPRFGKVLIARLWLAGHGFIAISAAGTFLERASIDAAVFCGERLDFVGKPICGDGLAYTSPEAVYREGDYLNTRALPDLSKEEEERFVLLVDQAKQAREAERKAVRAKWEEQHTRAMANRGVPPERAREQLRFPIDGRRFDLYRDFPLVFAQQGFATVADVLSNPTRYDGEACADPFEGEEYGRTTAKFYINTKEGKPVINSHAHGGMKYFLHATDAPPATAKTPRPEEPPFDPAYYEQFAPLDKPNPKESKDWQKPTQHTPQTGKDLGSEEDNLWGDPILFGSSSVVPEIECNVLPGVFGEYAQSLTDNIQTPPALAVLTIISVLSTSLAKKAEVYPWPDGEYSEPVNVWTLTVAESGERKSQILERCITPVRLWEKEKTRIERREIEQVASKRRSSERRADKLETEAAKEDDELKREELLNEAAQLRADMPEELYPTMVYTGSSSPEAAQELLTKAKGRLAFLSDEPALLNIMAGAYSSSGEALNDVFLQGYSGNDVRVSLRCRSAFVEKPAITLGLSIQPLILSEFPQAAKRKFRASGLFARFFVAYPTSNIGRRDVRRRVQICNDIQTAYGRAVMNLLEINRTEDEPFRLTLNEEALEIWLKFFEQIELGQSEGGQYQDIRDWAAKLPGGALRLAGLFHFAEWGQNGWDRPIDSETMVRAVHLALLLIEHTRAVFGLVGADKTADDAKAVWAWIVQTRKTGFLRSEAHKKFHSRFPKVEQLEEALNVLAGRELIHGPFKSKGPVGRSTIGYTVNPKALGESEA